MFRAISILELLKCQIKFMSIFTTPYHNDFIVDVAIRNMHQVTFTLMPDNWKNYVPLVNLKWKFVEFNDANHSKMPSNKGGVYTFVIVPSVAKHPKCAYPVYVGETNNFHTRYKSYLDDRKNPKARPLVRVMLGLWYGYLLYCYAEMDDLSLTHEVQNNLIRAFDPVINSVFPKDVQATVTAGSL